MSRARELASLASPATFTVDVANSRVGIASTMPRSTLDCGGELTSATLEVANFAPTDLSVPGTISAGTLTATGAVSSASITATGSVSSASITASGTITGGYITGNGHNITGISTLNIVDYGKNLGGGGSSADLMLVIGRRVGIAFTVNIPTTNTIDVIGRSSTITIPV